MQVGESYISDDCSKKFVCRADGTFKEKTGPQCHKQASCQIEDGRRGCHCKTGYRGDGIQTCEGKHLW